MEFIRVAGPLVAGVITRTITALLVLVCKDKQGRKVSLTDQCKEEKNGNLGLKWAIHFNVITSNHGNQGSVTTALLARQILDTVLSPHEVAPYSHT